MLHTDPDVLRFAAAFYAYVSFVPGFLAANVPGMTQLLALCSTMVQIILLALVAILTGIACDRGMPRMTVSAAILVVVGATLAPAALWMRSGGVVAAILVPSFYMLLIGVVGGAFCVAMCPLYPPEVRTSGLNFAHQVSATELVTSWGWLKLSAALCGSLSRHHRLQLG